MTPPNGYIPVEKRAHQFDAMHWCVRCGAGRADVLDGAREKECVAGNNVVSVSRAVRSKVLDALMPMHST